MKINEYSQSINNNEIYSDESVCFGIVLSETERIHGFLPIKLSLKGTPQCSDLVT